MLGKNKITSLIGKLNRKLPFVLLPILFAFSVPVGGLVFKQYRLFQQLSRATEAELNGIFRLKKILENIKYDDVKQVDAYLNSIPEESSIILDPQKDTYFWALMNGHLIPEMLEDINHLGKVRDEKLAQVSRTFERIKSSCRNDCHYLQESIEQLSQRMYEAAIESNSQGIIDQWLLMLEMFKARLRHHQEIEDQKVKSMLVLYYICFLMGVYYVIYFGKQLIRKEEKSEDQSRKLREAQSIAKIGSWTYDVLTGEQHWTSEHYTIFEIEEPQPQDLLYKRYRERIHPDDIKELDRIVERAVHFGESFIFDHRVYLDNGARIKYVQGLGKAHLNKEGKVVAISGTCQDLTEQRLLEMEKEKITKELDYERLKTIRSAKLASLGEMSAGIAHEINNPLTIIITSLVLLEKFSSDPVKLNAKIEVIKKSCDRISRIVNGLRKFSRSGGKSNITDESLEKIAREAMILTDAKARRHNTRITIISSTEASICCDEVEIEQVIVNLINNAIDANKIQKDKWVEITIDEIDDCIVLRVTDSGHGISEEVRAKIFDPFYTTKAVGEGTGLGLSIVKGILDEHKATINILTNTPNTCFEIRFSKLNRGMCAA